MQTNFKSIISNISKVAVAIGAAACASALYSYISPDYRSKIKWEIAMDILGSTKDPISTGGSVIILGMPPSIDTEKFSDEKRSSIMSVLRTLRSIDNDRLLSIESSDDPCKSLDCKAVSSLEVIKLASSVRKDRLDKLLLEASQQQAKASIFSAVLSIISIIVSVISLSRSKNS